MTKILLVEDDKSLREIYGVRLLAEGYDIVSAGDGEEALAMAIKEQPNLIISDVMMPKISGFDMLDILRSTKLTLGIKVIMMTALSSEDQRRRGEQLGADRYLVKSQVGIEDVVKTVHEVLADGHLTAAQRTADKSTPSEEPVPAANPVAQPNPTPSVQNVNPPQPQIAQPQSAPAQPTPTAPVQPNLQAQPVAAPASQVQATRPAPNFSANYERPVARMNAQPNVAPVQPQLAPQATPQVSAQPQSQPAYQESHLPQPTAPFSTDRPGGGSSERVIQPPAQDNDSEIREAQFAAELESVLGANHQPVNIIPNDISQG
ncbi:MAG: response regulator [bacterium]|nr:response regulator [bacterium]